MTLTSTDFARFFNAIHCRHPFPWQQALVDQLDRENCWPDVLDLPTGAGKTAVLDAAVFHLALRMNALQSAALRIVLVVDRRLVVDDADGRARKIASTLRDPSQALPADRAVVEEVARRLQLLAGAGAPPLVAARLRGGMPLEHDWARTPTQPTILCSTVDQVGSRLLFRGYGVSNRMKPVHAGLLGEGSLILLDEAHLSEPFLTTVRDVGAIGRAKVKIVVLTATPGGGYKRAFRLGPEDRDHPILKERIEATKPASLIKPIRSTDPAVAFARTAREMADELRRGGVDRPAIGVVVNRVDLARGIFEKLSTDDALDPLLLIGRSRDVDRERVVGRKLDPFRTGSEGRAEAGPLLVIATQCLEVGVDLDLDGLVTQAAPLDALRQRFGRLNRAGRPIAARGAILVTAESLANKADDPIYGDRIRKTWDVLTRIAKADSVDFGVAAFDLRLCKAKIDVAALAAHRARAPVLMPAYLDLWSQTSPPPSADPEVGLFLHGAERTPTEVSLVWRGDITSSDLMADGGEQLKAVLELVPPRSAEMVDVPIWAVAAWLRRSDTNLAARVADVPERENDLEGERYEVERKVFRWAGADDRQTGLVDYMELRPGDVLVVPADYGGCDAYGWAPEDDRIVEDVADEAARPYRGRRFTVRVAPDVVHWDRLSAVLAGTEDLTLDDLQDTLATEDDERSEGNPKRDVHEQLKSLRDARGGIDFYFPYGRHHDGVILVAAHGLEGEAERDQPVTEDDTLSYTSRSPVTLDDHTHAVVTHVERFTRVLGLAEHIADDLSLAAFLHDAGKADERFQTLLAGADWWNRPDGPVLAKSGRSTQREAWERAGLPKGWRHEAQSARMATAHPRFKEAHDPCLVLWLIGTHHGLGRPFFGFAELHDRDQAHDLFGCLQIDTWRLGPGVGPQSLAYDFKGLGWAAVFDKLKQRYGIWGLARLEAILRLADHRASSEAEWA